jgi:large repetitive protein
VTSKAIAQTYLMSSANNGQTINTCKGLFLDSGGGSSGACGEYATNENRTMTFCSPTPGKPIRISFLWWEIETNWDYLYVHNGPSTASPLVGTITGSGQNYATPMFFTSSGQCLTFRFTSDGIVNWCGWEAIIGCAPDSCNGNPPAADNCADAPVICDLDGYCGNTTGWYTPDNANIGTTGNSQFCGSIENNSWIAFIASATSASFQITSTNCSYSGYGIQGRIFSTSNCNTFTPISNCVSQDAGSGSFTLTTTGTLTIGQKYYIMIDGWAGNICDYSVRAISGAQAISINGPPNNQICQGQNTTLTVVGAPSGSTYQWSPAVAITGSTTGTSITTNTNSTVTYTVIVTTTGVCSTQVITYTLKVNPPPSVTISGGNSICSGGAPVTLTANGVVNAPPVSFSNNTSFNIPDDNNVGIMSPITISGFPGTVGTSLISVCMNIAHTFVGDLVVILRCPDGTQIDLSRRRGGSGDNFTNTCFSTSGPLISGIVAGGAPFTGTYQPEQPLPGLSSCLINGTWNLIVRDRAAGDVGQLLNWTISFGNTLTYSWSPATGLSATTGQTVTANPTSTTTYTVTVTDNSGCSSTATHTVNVGNNTLPTFNPITPICSGATPPTLPGTSTNGITGTWSPATVSNTASGTYTFTPTAGQCASSTTLSVTVNPATTPTFSSIAAICSGAAAPTLPGTSTNGISGTWSPTTVSNTASATYNFTPTAGQCATNASLAVTVNSIVTPTFNPIAPICSGAAAPTLPGTSTNGITGTWSPATVSNTTTGTYNFTPTAGQCASGTTVAVTVNPNVTPSFNPIPPICSGAAAPALPGTSTNGITGTWSPATVNNTASGTYTFTPTAGQCASSTTLSVTVNPATTPTFTPIAAICSGATPPTLPGTSTNGISGTWSPATVSNTANATYNFTPTAGQCATNASLSVTVNSIVTPTFNPIAPICSGAAAPTLPGTSTNGITGTWSPATVSNTATGTYNFTPTAGQCASGTSLSVSVNPNVTPVFNPISPICSGAPAPTLPGTSTNGITGTWSPVTVSNTASGTYNFTPTAGQCASGTSLSVTVYPVYSSTISAQICSGQNYSLPDGTVVSTANSYVVTLASVNGCDSVVTTNLTVNATINTTTNATICQGNTYVMPDGSVVSSSGIYTYTFTPPSGCDSIVTTNLTVNPTFSTSVDATICSGQTFTLPDGSSVSTAGSHPVTLSAVTGCDSVVTTNLTVNPTLSSTTNAAICQGGTYMLPDGSSVSAANTYTTTLSSTVTGCDSIVTTNLTVNPVYNTTVDAQICTGQTYTLPDGSVVSAANSYPVTLSSVNGCDSVVTTNLVVNSTLTSTTNATICQGDTYTLPDGSVVSAGGTYTHAFTLPSGCDSIVTTNLTANPTFSTSVNASICSGQAYTLPNGAIVSTAGAHPVTLSAVTGCDSVVTTNLTVNPTLSSTTNAAICQGGTYMLPDGSSVSVANTYTTTLSSTVTGCDSVVTTNLTINPIYNTSVNAQICTGQTYTLPDGSVVSAANSYPVTLSSVNGCDSVVTINLAVNSTLTSTTNATICQGDTYTLPDGSVVSTGGTFTHAFTLPSGCDSIVTTNLTVNPTFSTLVNASICSGQTFTLPDGSTVSTAGAHPVTLSAVTGCDSVVTTNLTVNPTLSSTTNAAICQGGTYMLPDGSSVSVANTYTTTLSSTVTGCDSVVTTNLTVNPIYNTSVNAQICTGQTYTLPDGSVVSAANSYPVTLSSVKGCDSVVTTNLSVNAILYSTINAEICLGGTHTLPDGTLVNTAGNYPVTLTSTGGCDSIITTNLAVVSSFNISVNTSICQGESFTLPDGSVVSTNGVYSTILTGSNGCDSIVTTNILVNPLPAVYLGPDRELCAGETAQIDAGAGMDTYTWSTGESTQIIAVTEDDMYSVLVTKSGCSATDFLSVSFDKPGPASFNLGPDVSICEDDVTVLSVPLVPGNTYLWQDGTASNSISVTDEGTYTLIVSNECGSVTDTIEVYLEICQTCEVYVPTAFTPNKDGANDTFYPLTTCDDILPYKFSVYNRWYELVFETNMPGVGWDGTFSGKEQPLDVYVYYVSYYDWGKNMTIVKKGAVTLIR